MENDHREEKNKRVITILMLPWLAHGHQSPFLELAKKLVVFSHNNKDNNYSFRIYLCSTPTNLSSIRNKVVLYDHIHLIDLHIPCSEDLPPHLHSTNGLPPYLMSSLKRAFHSPTTQTNFSTILNTLNPDLVIYDFLQPWAPVLASAHNIPAVLFVTFNSSALSSYLHLCSGGGGDRVSESNPFPDEIQLSDYQREVFGRMMDEKENITECLTRSNQIVLIRTFREIEMKYLNYLEMGIGKRCVPMGPLVSNPVETGQDDADFTRWLDGKKPSSTVLVSFGSEYYSPKEELYEIAKGLELITTTTTNNINFIWVVRFACGHSISSSRVEEKLPDGFLQRVGERGLVVQGWAPQMSILRHPSVGGFVSHCGWSSVMESLTIGVPIIAMPMHLDQFVNGKLVGAIGVGIEVERDAEGRYRGEDMAKVIDKVVVGCEGDGVRRKAKEMSGVMLNKGDEEEIGEVVREFVRICA